MLRRAILLLSIVLPLVTLDLAHKLLVPTQNWAFHPRGPAWIAMSAVVALGCLALTRVPSAAVAAMAGVLAAGAVGNGVSAVVWERGIPNPLVVDVGQAVIAFNFADIVTLVGVLLLMVGLSSITIRNREQLLPPREFARMLWQRVRS
ncbi:MAG: hypothetical protein MSC30_16000 [Gaiellaceae bacterium MAG52_C11]|nr:hypothetical protein [Candidatus Gaiellasilicea maunaloa]